MTAELTTVKSRFFVRLEQPSNAIAVATAKSWGEKHIDVQTAVLAQIAAQIWRPLEALRSPPSA